MALTNRTLWEVRSGGNDLNGAGYYDRGGASTDYTKQDAPQLSPADLATPGAGSTTLTSAAGGFTAAMVGNVIYIPASGNFVVGYYEITVFTDGNTVTLDRSATPAGAGAGGSGRVGGGRQTIKDATFLELISEGDTVWLESGTYALTENIFMTRAGHDTHGFCSIEGYLSVRGDEPTGDDRPLIQASTYDLRFAARWSLRHIRVTTEDSLGLLVGSYSYLKNVKSYATNASSASYAISLGTFSRAEECEAICPKGRGFQLGGYSVLIRCYAHHCNIGMMTGGSIIHILESIIAECRDIGSDLASNGAISFDYCVFDHCVSAIEDTAANEMNMENCQISHCVDGIKAASDSPTFKLDWNNFHGNSGADVTNCSKGSNASADDPAYTDDAALSGSTATTSSSVLTQSGGDFSTVTDGRDFIELISGTGIVAGYYQVTAHGATTVTLDRDPNDSAAGDIVWRLRTGTDFLPTAAAAGRGMAEVMANV